MDATAGRPIVDTRTYTQLVEDALARITPGNPQWTQFGVSDPGITLLEMLAFLGESLLVQQKLIPDPPTRLVDRYRDVLEAASASERGADLDVHERVRHVLRTRLASLAWQAVATLDDATLTQMNAIVAARQSPADE